MLSPLLAPVAPSKADNPFGPADACDPRPITSGLLAVPDRFLRPFAGLGRDTATLLALMLAVNAVVQPYAGFDHDGRLYALQTLERVQPGSFGDDLYLK